VCRCKTSRLNPFGRILHLFIVKLHFFAVFTDDFLLTFDITYPSKRYLNGSYHDYYILKQIQYPSNLLSNVDISMGPIGSSVYQSGKTEHILKSVLLTTFCLCVFQSYSYQSLCYSSGNIFKTLYLL
jgi:hypothetical protein